MALFAVAGQKRKHPGTKWIRLLAALLAVYLVLRWFEHRQVYQPDRSMDASGGELGRPFEDTFFSAPDGVRLNGWFFPADADSPRRNLAYLLCHGNAGNISHRLEHCSALLETGLSVFIFDYRGYGRSEGRPGEEGTYRDAQGAHRWLREKGFAATNIFALGESLGGGIASELALRETVGGLILQSTFASVSELGAELFPWLPVRRVGTIKYDTRSKLPRVRVPVLIMHSRADSLIGFQHAERNSAAANEPKLLWEIGGDHNRFLEFDRPRYLEGLNTYLKTVSKETVPSPVVESGSARP